MGKKSRKNTSGLVRKTINELVLDICTFDGLKAKSVELASRGFSEAELITALQDETSPLFKSLPLSELSKSENGSKYLQVLSIIQPKVLEAPVPAAKSFDLSNIIEVTDDNRDMMNIADEIFQGLDLSQNPEDFDMASFMTNVSQQIQKKISSGEIDMAALEGQANSMLDSIKNKPEFSSVLGGLESLGGDGGGDIMSFMMKNMERKE